MPTLQVRSVSMSCTIEGLSEPDLSLEGLLSRLVASYGHGAAGIGDPVQSVLVDRRACSWEQLLDQVEAWVHTQGYTYTSWVSDPTMRTGATTLHFHREPT